MNAELLKKFDCVEDYKIVTLISALYPEQKVNEIFFVFCLLKESRLECIIFNIQMLLQNSLIKSLGSDLAKK